jgi:hypothetical protein
LGTVPFPFIVRERGRFLNGKGTVPVVQQSHREGDARDLMAETFVNRPWLMLALLPAAITLLCYIEARSVDGGRSRAHRLGFLILPPVLGALLMTGLIVTEPPDTNGPGIADHVLILGIAAYSTLALWVALLLVGFRRLLPHPNRGDGS